MSRAIIPVAFVAAIGLIIYTIINNVPTQSAQQQQTVVQEIPVEKPHHDRLGFLTNIAQARIESHQTGKPVMMFFTASWCKYCYQLADTVLIRSDIAALTSQFICVEVDVDKHPELCNLYEAKSFPSLVFLGSQDQVLYRVVGMQTPEQLSAAIRTAFYSQARKPTPVKK
jgi:thioredoxin-like negative regulator of GroEL